MSPFTISQTWDKANPESAIIIIIVVNVQQINYSELIQKDNRRGAVRQERSGRKATVVHMPTNNYINRYSFIRLMQTRTYTQTYLQLILWWSLKSSNCLVPGEHCFSRTMIKGFTIRRSWFRFSDWVVWCGAFLSKALHFTLRQFTQSDRDGLASSLGGILWFQSQIHKGHWVNALWDLGLIIVFMIKVDAAMTALSTKLTVQFI